MPLQLQTKIRFFSTGDRRQRISSLIAAGTETRQSYPLQKHQTQGWVVLYDNQHTSSCEFLSKAGTLGREVTKNALMPSVFADVLRGRNGPLSAQPPPKFTKISLYDNLGIQMK